MINRTNKGRVVAGACLALATSSVAAPAHADLTVTLPTVSLSVSLPLELALGGQGIIGSLWGDVTPEQERSALDAQGNWSAARDVGSLHSLTARKGIQAKWRAGITGEGVTVAVIDTGIAPVPGLTGADKVVNGPDLSFDSQSAGARYVDGFGHGTHMAGIIAGRDPSWSAQYPDPKAFAGVAPQAQLLNMKVGAADGGVDVSQVIAAINWVVQHRTDRGMNVRVISLAYGTSSTQSWQVDPLARAVEDAQKAGIVVVAAAGNDGLSERQLLMPAIDPHVIAVGAVDPRGTNDVADDVVADFTNGGNLQRRPDVVTPGRSLVSLRVPGSYADVMAPGGKVLGDVSGRFFRGSGTSQATAFVAGEAALLLQQRPGLSPAQVKSLLTTTARPLTNAHPAMGAGETNASRAAQWPVPLALTTAPPSSGTGTLEASRGGSNVLDPRSGKPLTGEVDILGGAWNGTRWARQSGSASAWAGGAWNGKTWTGKAFDRAGNWQAVPWRGTTWGGEYWSSHQTAASWEARSWRNQNWEARSWRADSWAARTWRSLVLSTFRPRTRSAWTLVDHHARIDVVGRVGLEPTTQGL